MPESDCGEREKTPEAEPEAELPSPLTGPWEMKDGFLVLQGEKPLEIGGSAPVGEAK